MEHPAAHVLTSRDTSTDSTNTTEYFMPVGDDFPDWMDDHEPILSDHELVDHHLDEPCLLLDIPFVPSDEKVIRAMLDLAALERDDLLYDLGCGDGRIVVAAALQKGVRAIGIDLDPLRIAEAMEYAGNARVEHLVDFIEEDLLEADFSAATVVCLYLLDSINLQLRPRLQQALRPGTRIVSHTFRMGDWEPDAHIQVDGSNVYQWVVPAAVAGHWQWEDEQGRTHRLELEQKHQMLEGHIHIDGQTNTLIESRIDGNLLDLRWQSNETGAVSRLRMHHEDGELILLDSEI